MELEVERFIASGKVSGKGKQLKTHIPKEIQERYGLKGGETLLFLKDEGEHGADDEYVRLSVVIKRK